jgi:hypothetical protein
MDMKTHGVWDVFGKNPDSELGECFSGFTSWSWHVLWVYFVNDRHPGLAANSGLGRNRNGLCAPDSLKLGELLMADVVSGEAARFVDGRVGPLAAQGATWITDWELDVETIRRFADFLQHCGGFDTRQRGPLPPWIARSYIVASGAGALGRQK